MIEKWLHWINIYFKLDLVSSSNTNTKSCFEEPAPDIICLWFEMECCNHKTDIHFSKQAADTFATEIWSLDNAWLIKDEDYQFHNNHESDGTVSIFIYLILILIFYMSMYMCTLMYNTIIQQQLIFEYNS